MDEAEWNARFSVHVFRGSIRSAAFAGTMPDGFAREPSSRAERIECQICSRGLIPVFFGPDKGRFDRLDRRGSFAFSRAAGACRVSVSPHGISPGRAVSETAGPPVQIVDGIRRFECISNAIAPLKINRLCKP
ncbi:hypothetical protein V4E86_31320 [Burkholderia pseudomallei]|uniref:Uncharacterized protein n=2 Tax=Burkholderia pseudomallei TaxID=28450 RepID=A0A8A4FP91_BURPE|nr:hypothetical protein [Burkholderia pseudomallei]MBD2938714.1 hypothetical protein [Burkholderia pseudomallei]MBD2944117.1 hypothetical protein [Burkholderia pseudomallei]MBD2950293.1 hypothetical protein [Burkholderia pseudomallei]MBD2954527.1 hypothetical protein [Burkholderia pseudomallei]MBD2960859.1 hypothetical protein [Burkholderia pseudomallei]